jgi:hypothetical protein
LARCTVELLYAVVVGQVRPDVGHLRCGGGPQVVRGGGELGVVGGHEHVEAVVGELAGQLAADTAGCPGDNGQRSRGSSGGHVASSP